MITDITKDFIINKLLKSRQFKRVLRLAKKIGYIDIQFTGCEKWNYPRDDKDYDTLDGPNKDGHYDIEGYSWEDVTAKVRLNLLNPFDLYTYIKSYLEYKEWEKEYYTWMWTIESFEIIKHDLAEEIANEKYPLDSVNFGITFNEDNTVKLNEHTKEEEELIRKNRQEEKKQLEIITRRDILLYIRQVHYKKIALGMYVNLDDPTIILVDEKYFKFDMKNGWSRKKLIKILNKWLKTLDFDYKVRYTIND